MFFGYGISFHFFNGSLLFLKKVLPYILKYLHPTVSAVVTYPSTNWARLTVTSLMKTNALPLSYTAPIMWAVGKIKLQLMRERK